MPLEITSNNEVAFSSQLMNETSHPVAKRLLPFMVIAMSDTPTPISGLGLLVPRHAGAF